FRDQSLPLAVHHRRHAGPAGAGAARPVGCRAAAAAGPFARRCGAAADRAGGGMNDVVLAVANLHKAYGGLQVTRDVSLSLRQVELAIHEREGSVRGFWRPLDAYAAVQDEAMQILAALHMEELAASRPVDLSYGQQRLVEIALAMALRPKVLLLDEPMAGVPGTDRETVLRALDTLPASLAILMIEHDMDLIFSFARRIVVL